MLSPECAALVALGDPKDVYAAYESALGTSLLASQLKKFESTLGLPVRLRPPWQGSVYQSVGHHISGLTRLDHVHLFAETNSVAAVERTVRSCCLTVILDRHWHTPVMHAGDV